MRMSSRSARRHRNARWMRPLASAVEPAGRPAATHPRCCLWGGRGAPSPPFPQVQAEAKARARNMVAQMDQEGFGHCTNQSECQAVCPKEISVDFIAQLNREYLKSF